MSETEAAIRAAVMDLLMRYDVTASGDPMRRQLADIAAAGVGYCRAALALLKAMDALDHEKSGHARMWLHRALFHMGIDPPPDP